MTKEKYQTVTNVAEANVLVAALDDDLGAVEDMLDDFLPGELDALYRACQDIMRMIVRRGA